jgi:hypothetical protein
LGQHRIRTAKSDIKGDERDKNLQTPFHLKSPFMTERGKLARTIASPREIKQHRLEIQAAVRAPPDLSLPVEAAPGIRAAV